MYLQKVISRNTFLNKFVFVGILKVNDENSKITIRIRTRIRFRTRLRIRIH
jgi:hypothetical protein